MLDFFKNMDWQTLLIIGVVIYMVLTKKIDLSSIFNIFKPAPQPGPVVVPGTPAQPLDISSLLQLLLQMMLTAKQSGDTELERAATVMAERAMKAQQSSFAGGSPVSMFIRPSSSPLV